MKKRILYYVPILHSPRSFLDDIELAKRFDEKILFEKAQKAYQDRIESIKRKLKEKIEKGRLDCKNLFIYSDSWDLSEPIKAGSDEVKKKIKEIEDRDLMIVTELIDRGATLMPTENRIILKGYHKNKAKLRELVQELENLEPGNEKVRQEWDEKWQEVVVKYWQLMMLRDEYVARTIDRTLPKEGTGILFMGEAHRVIEKLNPAKFKIIYLLGED